MATTTAAARRLRRGMMAKKSALSWSVCYVNYIVWDSSSPIEDNNFGFCVWVRVSVRVCAEFLSHRILTPCISIFFNGLSLVDDCCWFLSSIHSLFFIFLSFSLSLFYALLRRFNWSHRLSLVLKVAICCFVWIKAEKRTRKQKVGECMSEQPNGIVPKNWISNQLFQTDAHTYNSYHMC